MVLCQPANHPIVRCVSSPPFVRGLRVEPNALTPCNTDTQGRARLEPAAVAATGLSDTRQRNQDHCAHATAQGLCQEQGRNELNSSDVSAYGARRGGARQKYAPGHVMSHSK